VTHNLLLQFSIKFPARLRFVSSMSLWSCISRITSWLLQRATTSTPLCLSPPIPATPHYPLDSCDRFHVFGIRTLTLRTSCKKAAEINEDKQPKDNNGAVLKSDSNTALEMNYTRISNDKNRCSSGH